MSLSVPSFLSSTHRCRLPFVSLRLLFAVSVCVSNVSGDQLCGDICR